MMTIDHAAPKVPPEIQAKLDKLFRQAEAAEDRQQGNYASLKRSMARSIYASLGFHTDHLPEWAAERPRGGNALDYEARSQLARRTQWERDEALKQQEKRHREDEDNFQCNQEYALQQWHQEHGPAFADYLITHPCFATLELWAVLGRVAALWEKTSGDKRPFPPPPVCGRSDFLATIPPGTHDFGRDPGNRVVLADDWTITPGNLHFEDTAP